MGQDFENFNLQTFRFSTARFPLVMPFRSDWRPLKEEAFQLRQVEGKFLFNVQVQLPIPNVIQHFSSSAGVKSPSASKSC